MTLIVGNTYPVKDALKALGARWDPDKRGWLVPDDQLDKAKSLVASAPKSVRSSSGLSSRGGGWRSGRTRECEECGEYATPGTRCWETGLIH